MREPAAPARTMIAGTLWKNATQMPAMIVRLTDRVRCSSSTKATQALIKGVMISMICCSSVFIEKTMMMFILSARPLLALSEECNPDASNDHASYRPR